MPIIKIRLKSTMDLIIPIILNRMKFKSRRNQGVDPGNIRININPDIQNRANPDHINMVVDDLDTHINMAVDDPDIRA
jgi:hypothetical protein